MTSTNNTGFGWDLSASAGAIGTGNWKWFPADQLPRVYEVIAGWKEVLTGIDKPWLCWCVDEDWCWYQQQLVRASGWTPVVGTDGRVPRPRLIPEAVFVDFNEQLRYPIMWMHFPLEFVHMFCNRLAFWHSDLLPPLPVVRQVAAQFDTIVPGEVMAVDMTRVGLRQRIRRYLKGRDVGFKRYFELVGCTTAAASRSQFEHGCGWWRHIEQHINSPPDRYERRPHFDNGVGIWYWEQLFGGKVVKVAENVHPFHYSTNQRKYRRRRDEKGRPLGDKRSELSRSFDLDAIVRRLGLPE